MNSFSKNKIEQSILNRKKLHQRFYDNSETYRHFLKLEKSAFSEGEISVKHKELMALSMSIITKCEPCIEWHTEQALLASSTDSEFFETIDVAIEMGGGPAGAYARFALNCLDYFKDKHNR
ncbi:carboxymuconolactone decarboxylase family protein [Sediminispirochaeta smaragdinae]|uniref:Alkylhydroperoxidase like protein, AhpD family n=1 Tax=Sediminispirochaeta smaragdinae (strain DSM 11293 / JCM 15392 / SEBR 4228) TaxID=573413 RepID=E1R321_SEDSS|nr:carboxymuconolactone decarboxylase family protein [Sediminispirochaeta smaragdinae]ADK81207.1 alkylhydroperoxidase like protein, AhpD family [Sediminispirochaeta smaragdinae DSM 11293]